MKKQTIDGNEAARQKELKSAAVKIEKALNLMQSINDYKALIKDLEKELEPIRTFFDSTLIEGEIIETEKGKAIKKVTNSYSVSESGFKILKSLFGKKIKDYVSEKINYGATTKLKQTIKDDSLVNIATIREAVIINKSTNVVFETNK
jgi:hypothetical protein